MRFFRYTVTGGFLLAGLGLSLLGAQDDDEGVLTKVLEPTGVKASGFVVGSYYSSSRDSKDQTFSLEQFELDLTRKVGIADLVVDLDFHDGSSQATGFTFTGGDTGEIEQAYIGFTDILISGLNAQFGKWNAPIGLEGYDAPDRWQWSASYIFFNAIPANMTGLKLEYAPDSLGGFGLEGFISNGWDNNNDKTTSSGNTEKTYGIGLHYSNDLMTWAADFFSGSETLRSTGISQSRRHRRNVFDTWIQLNTDFVAQGSWIAFEYLVGTEDQTSTVDFRSDGVTAADSRWEGHMVKAHVPLNREGDVENLGLTLRYETFSDPDAYILPTPASRSVLNLGTTEDLRVQAWTAALNFIVPETNGAVMGNLEYRHDQTNHAAFNDTRGGGSDASDNDTAALNLIYSF